MSRNIYMLPGAPEQEATPQGLVHAGDVLHCRVSGTTMFGRSWSRGESFRVDAADIAHSINKHGESFLDRELAKGVDGKLGLGEWPADAPTWTPGSVEHVEAKEAARKAAWAEPNPAVRLAALKRVEEEFGSTGSTSRTISAAATDPQERRAAEQRARLDADGPRAVSRYSPTRTPEEERSISASRGGRP